MIYLLCLIQLVTIVMIYTKFEAMKKRHGELEKWLFDSLYTIDSNVLAPKEQIKPVTRRAKIINRHDDPMNEFTGYVDDWHD